MRQWFALFSCIASTSPKSVKARNISLVFLGRLAQKPLRAFLSARSGFGHVFGAKRLVERLLVTAITLVRKFCDSCSRA